MIGDIASECLDAEQCRKENVIAGRHRAKKQNSFFRSPEEASGLPEIQPQLSVCIIHLAKDLIDTPKREKQGGEEKAAANDRNEQAEHRSSFAECYR